VGKLPIPGASAVADSIAGGSADAFVQGFHHAVLLGAAVTAIAFVIVMIWLPARARASDLSGQEAEYRAEHAPAEAAEAARAEVAPAD
jgi:hypothetical protein